MKASIAILFAFGIASQPALAQTHGLPHERTPSADTGMQPQEPSSQMPPATEMRPEPGTGTSSGSSGMPMDSHKGAMPDASSGGPNAMQSEAGMELRAAAPPAAELKPMVQGDVTYLCGGVGAEEAAYMKRQAKDYDLMLTFATRSGAYLADVDVEISDARGTSVLEANCDAPIMLVDLPRSGNYKVRADTAGYELSRTVKVATGKKTRQSVAAASLVWPQQVAEIPAEGSTATGGASGRDGAGEAGEESTSNMGSGAR